MNKSYDNSHPEQEKLCEEDLKLINGYAQKEMTADEVFTFSVILCDNEIDRDFERFTVDALYKLAELFVGKTAIKNHSCNADDQSARTYKTQVVTDESRKNSLGEPYAYVKAYCYMPRLAKNEDLIKEIQSGIKKEVSVGCSVSTSTCSICGSDTAGGACHHKKGRRYKGKLCYHELSNPYDAYEWSFVAVPAQKNAGVTKNFKYIKENDMKDVVKSLSCADGDVMLTAEQAHALYGYIEDLAQKAADGEQYRSQLENDTVRQLALNFPELSDVSSRNICSCVSTKELKQLNDALRQRKNAISAPQLLRQEKDGGADNSQFRF